jgi:5-methylcytosine-specific restriction endonuclease McrA
MGHKNLVKLRDLAFARQGGLCCYCQLPMVITDRAQANHGTAEHLLPRSEGGRNT